MTVVITASVCMGLLPQAVVVLGVGQGLIDKLESQRWWQGCGPGVLDQAHQDVGDV